MRSHRVSLGHARAGSSIAGSCPTLAADTPLANFISPLKQNREVPPELIVLVDGRFRFSDFFISSTRGYGQRHLENVFYSLLLEGQLTKLYQGVQG